MMTTAIEVLNQHRQTGFACICLEWSADLTAKTLMSTREQHRGHVATVLEEWVKARMAPATTLATVHIDELNIDLLVTVWPDGTGEVAYRPGHEQRWITWSPPWPLDMAPGDERRAVRTHGEDERPRPTPRLPDPRRKSEVEQ